jgi:hypothetical protein
MPTRRLLALRFRGGLRDVIDRLLLIGNFIGAPTPQMACFPFWDCRECGGFRTQNILVDPCTGEVVGARQCGEDCL